MDVLSQHHGRAVPYAGIKGADLTARQKDLLLAVIEKPLGNQIHQSAPTAESQLLVKRGLRL